MYKRPVFRLFTVEDQRIASIKDPLPTGEDMSVSGQVFNPFYYGKLLASGEAGYYDIQSQDYSVNRPTKPSGEGIDYQYPNPPQASGNIQNPDQYWGSPKNMSSGLHPDSGTKAFFQSGIFIPPNDDTGSGLQYYYMGSGVLRTSGEPEGEGQDPEVTETDYFYSVGSGIFHYNQVSGKFSNAFNSVNSGLLKQDGSPFYSAEQAKCLPNPYGFNTTDPEFLTRDLILPMSIPSGEEFIPVAVPFLGDYEVLTAPTPPSEEEGSGIYKNKRKDIKSKVEKILEGYTDIKVTEEEKSDEETTTDEGTTTGDGTGDTQGE